MAETAIEWATHVWNPVTGCDRVSPGCAHCYALTYAARLKAMGQPKYQRDGGKASGPGFGVTLHESELAAPARWRKPRRVFVNSMSDLFHEQVPREFIGRVFEAMDNAEPHQFLVLTKRPERMLEVMRWMGESDDGPALRWPVPNVWLGVTIENRRFVHRADLLRATPAAVRFISAEPLLGPLLAEKPGCPSHVWDGPYRMRCSLGGDGNVCARHGKFVKEREGLDLTGIDWLIVGGESGPDHRPIREEWVRDLRDAARAAGTAFFFKQWGGRTPKAGGRELDGRMWDEVPRTTREAVAA